MTTNTKPPITGTTEKNYLALPLDVTSQSAIDSAISQTLEKFGRIDVLVNNAGYGLAGEFESLSDDQIRKQMEVNFFGLINVTRAGIKAMREQKPAGGLIQQVTSIGGQKGVPFFSIYCASKVCLMLLASHPLHELSSRHLFHYPIITPRICTCSC